MIGNAIFRNSSYLQKSEKNVTSQLSEFNFKNYTFWFLKTHLHVQAPFAVSLLEIEMRLPFLKWNFMENEKTSEVKTNKPI